MGIYGNRSVKLPAKPVKCEPPKAAAIFASPFNKRGNEGDFKTSDSHVSGSRSLRHRRDIPIDARTNLVQPAFNSPSNSGCRSSKRKRLTTAATGLACPRS